jgi:hypothetical protein
MFAHFELLDLGTLHLHLWCEVGSLRCMSTPLSIVFFLGSTLGIYFFSLIFKNELVVGVIVIKVWRCGKASWCRDPLRALTSPTVAS